MNAHAQYLAWLRINHPAVYMQALRRVVGKPRGLGGLSDDLLARMCRPTTGFGFLGDDSIDTSDLPTITVEADTPSMPDLTDLVVDPASLTTPSIDLTDNTLLPALPNPTPPTDSSGSSVFDSIAKAVATVASTAMSASSQSNLLKLNTQRATQGLPPVDANGIPVRTSLLRVSSNPTIANLERTIAGAATSPLVWVAGLGILALLLLGRRA